MRKIQQYLSEFIYGGIDGSVTTFAVVAGATGAHLESSVIIVLGMANLFADGFAMSIGSYLSAKSKKLAYKNHEKKEYWEIENMRTSEEIEIKEIFTRMGFEGELLEKAVNKITENEEQWVELMMKYELGLIPENKSPISVGFATLLSFVSIGFIPILIYVTDYFHPIGINLFVISSLLTAIVFLFIGALKGWITQSNVIKQMLETLLLGTIAALLAYYVGSILEHIIMK